jgi:hypothetical protein
VTARNRIERRGLVAAVLKRLASSISEATPTASSSAPLLIVSPFASGLADADMIEMRGEDDDFLRQLRIAARQQPGDVVAGDGVSAVFTRIGERAGQLDAA